MNTLPVPPGISPLGGIFYLKSVFVAIVCFVCIDSLQAQAENEAPNNSSDSLGWNITPFYTDINQVGSEAGGKRDEKRNQNRARHLHRIGLEINHVSQSNKLWQLKSSWMTYNDYAYYNENEDIHVDDQRLSEAFFKFCSDSNCINGNDVGADVLFVPESIKKKDAKFQMQAGRQMWAMDRSGLFFVGESPSFIAEYKQKVSEKKTLSLGAAGSILERQYRTLRGLQKSKQTPSTLYLIQATLLEEKSYLSLLYGFLRAPGRSAEVDVVIPYSLPGLQTMRHTIPSGQSAMIDMDVHYYGISGLLQKKTWGLLYQLRNNYGRTIAVDRDGTRINSSRKSIQGSMAYLNLFFLIGKDIETKKCSVAFLIVGACLDSVDQMKTHKIAFHTLYSTRDSNEDDQDLKGFSSPRPSLGIMGGGASILLSGVPGTIENPAFQNRQPASDFSLNQNFPLESFSDYRDNSDPALPDFNNDGIRMGGIQYSYGFQNKHLQTFTTFLNYAAYRFADAYEIIFALLGNFTPGSKKSAKKKHDMIRWQISATGSWYKKREREEDPYTKVSFKSPTQFYSRFQAMVSFSF